MNKKKAVWFSRHTPTEGQLADIRQMGYQLVAVPEGMALGSVNYDGTPSTNVVPALLELAKKNDAVVVFGVYHTQILSAAFAAARFAVQRGDWVSPITLFAAVNMNRSVEGGKPTFQHLSWEDVGALERL